MRFDERSSDGDSKSDAVLSGCEHRLPLFLVHTHGNVLQIRHYSLPFVVRDAEYFLFRVGEYYA